jgi:hypothetical protein
VRWRAVAILHGLVVDWHFSPRTQACSEPEIIIARGETIKSKMVIRTALPTAGLRPQQEQARLSKIAHAKITSTH